MAPPATAPVVNPYLMEVIKLLGSLLVGIFVGVFMRRRKFAITIVSVLPSAKGKIPGYTCELPEELHQTLEKYRWTELGRDFQKREDIAVLYEQLRLARVFYKATPLAREVLDECIHKVECPSGVDLAEVVHQFLNNHILGRLIIGLANRREITLPDPPAEDAARQPAIPYFENLMHADRYGCAGTFILQFSENQINLGFRDPSHREQMHKLAVLLSFPEKDRLLVAFRAVKEHLLSDTEQANQIIDSIEPLVFKKSRWLVRTQLTNVGHSPVSLGSSGTLRAKCGNKTYDPMQLIYRTDIQTAADPQDDGEKESQMDKDIDAFGIALDPQDDISTENIVIPPGESRTVYFVSEKPIETQADGEELLSFWSRSMPEYKIDLGLIPRSLLHGGTASSHWLKM